MSDWYAKTFPIAASGVSVVRYKGSEHEALINARDAAYAERLKRQEGLRAAYEEAEAKRLAAEQEAQRRADEVAERRRVRRGETTKGYAIMLRHLRGVVRPRVSVAAASSGMEAARTPEQEWAAIQAGE